MGGRNVPLNPAQIEVLTWIRDGCALGVYEDWSHRITARALHNRGLITVKGRGTGWTVSLAEDGTYYLDHGSYPSVPASSPAEAKKPFLTPEGDVPWSGGGFGRVVCVVDVGEPSCDGQ